MAEKYLEVPKYKPQCLSVFKANEGLSITMLYHCSMQLLSPWSLVGCPGSMSSTWRCPRVEHAALPWSLDKEMWKSGFCLKSHALSHHWIAFLIGIWISVPSWRLVAFPTIWLLPSGCSLDGGCLNYLCQRWSGHHNSKSQSWWKLPLLFCEKGWENPTLTSREMKPPD